MSYITNISIFAALLSATTVLAQDGGWSVISTKESKITKPEKIAEFITEHRSPEFEELRTRAVSRQLAGLAIDKVVSITVTLNTLKWTGATKCASNDPRLTTETIGYDFTFESGHGSGSASSPVEQDPCDTAR